MARIRLNPTESAPTQSQKHAKSVVGVLKTVVGVVKTVLERLAGLSWLPVGARVVSELGSGCFGA